MKIQDSHCTDLLAKKGTVWRRLEGRSKKHKQGIYMTGKWEPGKERKTMYVTVPKRKGIKRERKKKKKGKIIESK